MTTFITEAEAQIHCTVDGVSQMPSTRSWTTFEGGDPEASTSQLNPGAGINAVAIPGPVKRSVVTLTRPYTKEMHAVVIALEGALNNHMSASYTPTDADGNTLAVDTVTYTGILKQVKKPKWDAESGKAGMLTLVMEANT